MTWPHELLRTIYNDPDTTRKTRRHIRASLPPTEVDYRGCRMLVHPADNNTEFQIWRWGRTHEERALRNIIKRLKEKPFYALDVGANAGSFSVRLGAAALSGSVVHAFEPNPEMRARLVNNLQLNPSTSVRVHGCAISDTPGEMELHLPNGNLGEARLLEPFRGGKQITVPVRCLTEFLPDDPDQRVDFLKVDIEGFEDRAMMPLLADQHRAQLPRMIFFEHKHSRLWQTDITQDLLAADYKLDTEYGRNALYVLQE